jgi:hypothetical protein
MQYEDPSAQRPPGPQRPEQQSVFAVQVLFALVHVTVDEMGAHLPPMQFPVQQSLPETGHAAPMVKHWTSLHLPETHAPLQQSVLPTQAAVAGAHTPMDEAHWPVVGSQRPEQHDAPEVHA